MSPRLRSIIRDGGDLNPSLQTNVYFLAAASFHRNREQLNTDQK